MNLNAKDLKDLEGIVYWSSAAKANIESIDPQTELTAHTIEMIDKVSACAERIMLGVNRK